MGSATGTTSRKTLKREAPKMRRKNTSTSSWTEPSVVTLGSWRTSRCRSWWTTQPAMISRTKSFKSRSSRKRASRSRRSKPLSLGTCRTVMTLSESTTRRPSSWSQTWRSRRKTTRSRRRWSSHRSTSTTEDWRNAPERSAWCETTNSFTSFSASSRMGKWRT